MRLLFLCAIIAVIVSMFVVAITAIVPIIKEDASNETPSC
jgi:hypothetical protein